MRITIIYIQGTDTSSAKSLHQNVVQQQISEISILKAELETSKENFKQLSDIHSKCRSQKEKASVAISTSTDDEVTFTM